MSESFNSEYKPSKTRYKPALYNNIIILLLLVKYNEIITIKNSNIKKSENTTKSNLYIIVYNIREKNNTIVVIKFNLFLKINKIDAGIE